jgi:uncharacterized repeat protein (TIGR03803 family)
LGCISPLTWEVTTKRSATQKQQNQHMKSNPSNLCGRIVLLAVVAVHLTQVQRTQAQTWSTNNPLKVARWAHMATSLTNGTVLIAGGIIYNVSGVFADTNACELYNPASGTSSLTDPMQRSRHSHRATLLANGQVLITGGGGDASSEVYDPAGGTWSNLASMNDERIVHTATLLPGGQVLAAAGYDDNNGLELSSAELYDPATGTWANTASMPYAADTLAGVLLTNGKVLVCGGYDGTKSITNAVLYNPVSHTWANTAPMNEARAGHTATVLTDGRVLVEGGTGCNSAEVYDPVAATWTYVAPMNDGRLYPEACLLSNGQVMVLGDGNTDVELYDPASDTWTYTDSLPVPGNFQTATVLVGGQVVVTGGSVSEYNGPALAVVEIYGSVSTTPGLTVTASPLTGPVPLTVQFTSPGVDSAGNTVTNWNWSFGDGAASSAQSPSHIYTNGGSFSPSLAAYSTYGASPLSVTGPGTITVTNHTLNVAASPQAGPVPLTVQFTSPGVDSGGNTVTNWNWSFGDGAASSAQSPSHIYTNVGSFSPSLAVYSTYGASPLSVIGPGTITVTNHTLNVAASPQAGPVPLTVQFTSPGVDSGGNTVTNWNWSFGDGGTSPAQNPSHGYTSIGSFSPNLVARSTFGAGPLAITGLGGITVTNTPNLSFRTLYSFNPAFAADPSGNLVLSGNTLYGTTLVGGTSNYGTLFALNISGSGFTNLYSFNLTSGGKANGVILSGSTLYGPTDFGGTRGGGTVFAISTNGTGYTNLFNLNFVVDPNSPSSPQAPLVLAGNNLYGATWFGGAYNHGTVFSVATNGASSGILHSFYIPNGNNINPDGIFPATRLLSSGSTLYGTALDGGTSGYGAVFAVNTNDPGSFRILHYFTAPNFTTGTNTDGANPWAGLVLSGSTLYGATYSGGNTGNGTVFAVNTDSSGFTNLYSFTGGNGGSGPHAGLTLSGNTLYGTTSGGGTSSNGTLFVINTNGSGFTSLYSFTGGSDGADPQSDLVLSGNTLYGTAVSGGSSGHGTVFSFSLRPRLNITPEGANVILTWSTSASGYALQSTTNLGAAAFWGSVSPLPVIVNGQNTVTNPISGSHKFYRLSQ